MILVSDFAVYGSLFLVSLAAATILPLQSEATLTGLLLTNAYPVWLLLVIASTGNTAGSFINWMLGRSIETYRHKRWFPFKMAALDKAQAFYLRYGKWTLLLSWVPIIGDPLTVIAGVMRVPPITFLSIVAIAKTTRYLVVAWLVQP